MHVSIVKKAVIAALPVAMAMASAVEAGDKAKRLNFVGCPVMRDTEMVPCWLAEHEGELYYLGIQLDLQSPFFPPQLLHKALVEGVVTEEKKCGGIVLDPVTVTSLPEIDRNCNTVLPAEGYEITDARRGVGPDPDTLSARNQAKARAVKEYEPPFEEKTFTVYFDFDDSYMPTRANRNVTEAMRYATASHAAAVNVVGFWGVAKLSDGTKMKEKESVIRDRLSQISYALVDIGVPEHTVSVSDKIIRQKADGVDDFVTRRVEIIVTP